MSLDSSRGNTHPPAPTITILGPSAGIVASFAWGCARHAHPTPMQLALRVHGRFVRRNARCAHARVVGTRIGAGARSAGRAGRGAPGERGGGPPAAPPP